MQLVTYPQIPTDYSAPGYSTKRDPVLISLAFALPRPRMRNNQGKYSWNAGKGKLSNVHSSFNFPGLRLTVSAGELEMCKSQPEVEISPSCFDEGETSSTLFVELTSSNETRECARADLRVSSCETEHLTRILRTDESICENEVKYCYVRNIFKIS